MGEDNLIRPADFTREREKIGVNWRVREGLHGLVGRLRIPGTALIVEDVCVPPARIAEAAKDIQALLGEHGFLTGVAGHTSAGNLHFMLTPDFAKQEDLDRYEAFMEGLVELVCDKYDGSLKAEHGTGVNMAPYVAREWGEQATELMWRVKRLADPDGVLGPGVVMNDDPAVHLQNLKTTPEVEEIVEHLRRVRLLRARLPQPRPDHHATPADRPAARDGPPARGIAGRQGAGQGIRVRRRSRRAPRTRLRPRLPARDRHGQAHQGAPGREALEARGGDGAPRRQELEQGRAQRRARASAPGRSPSALGGGDLPKAAQSLPGSTKRDGAAAVYFPSCTNRIMGASKKARPGPSLADATVAVSERAGMPVWIPPDVGGSCCGVPWSSKGHREAHEWMARQTFEKLWAWSGEGELPIVSDASSCTLGLSCRDARRPP